MNLTATWNADFIDSQYKRWKADPHSLSKEWRYFFEGFMLSLASKFLPILVLLAYVNEAYQPNNLLKLFGREYIFKFGGGNAEATPVGAVFWFVVSMVLIYLLIFTFKKLLKLKGEVVRV